MSTRISEVLATTALLSLAACGTQVETDAERAARAKAELARAEAEGRIPCAVGGAAEFTTNCTIDRARTQDGLILTVRHPDGGFHRLRVTTDGRGVVAADGARQATVSVIDKDAIEVAIEDARYRLPARVKGGS
ncbi:hypothetical protein OK349_01320 [Sphingomonas sp. BT-65]|uniref:hypothetical protein n=1 Tax=Sphingomonas sp. BT-65 TaxID=2989821 RepID=UPI002235A830|nr:hypothetical protein [Sphingomonas sp. BT-65]MCW4460333.1 hypothetical protein [Sphingomonas sp. BT-65]